MEREKQLLAALDLLGFSWFLFEHEAVYTVEASSRLHQEIEGLHTKNLFLKDKADAYWLVTAPHDARIDLKSLPSLIGSKKLSFGNADDMQKFLGVTPGSVTPLAAFNDERRAVTIVLDTRLAAADRVNVHPLRNTATLGILGTELAEFLCSIGHPPIILDLLLPLDPEL
jgi:Ala-tRNA(Pro) deacylase